MTNLANLRAAEVTPTVGTVGRVSEQGPDVTGAVAGLVQGLANVYTDNQTKKAAAEDASALASLLTTSYETLQEADEEGVTEEDRGEVNDLASQVQRVGGLRQRGGLSSAERVERVLLQRAHDIVKRRPHMTKEVVGLLGPLQTRFEGAFVDKEAGEQAKADRELMQARVQEQQKGAMAYDRRVATMTQTEFIAWRDTDAVGIEWSMRQADLAQHLLATQQLDADYKRGMAVDKARWVAANRGNMATMRLNLDGQIDNIIRTQPSAQALVSIQRLGVDTEQQIRATTQFLDPAEFTQNYGWIAQAVQLGVEVAGQGPQATVAKNTRDTYQAVQETNFIKQFPDAPVVELAARLEGMGGQVAGRVKQSLLNNGTLDRAIVYLNSFTTSAPPGRVDYGPWLDPDPSQPQRPSRDTSGIVPAMPPNVASVKDIFTNSLAQWDNLTPEAKADSTRWIRDAMRQDKVLTDPAKLDALVETMAQSNFGKLLDDPQAGPELVLRAPLVIDALGVQLQAAWPADSASWGELELVDQPGTGSFLRPKDATRGRDPGLKVMQQRIDRMIRAIAQVNGVSEQEAVRIFNDRYLQ